MILVSYDNLEDASIAITAVKAHHSGTSAAALLPSPSKSVADLIYETVSDPAKLGDGARVIVKTLGKAPPQDLVPGKLLQGPLVEAGLVGEGKDPGMAVRAWFGRLSADLKGPFPEAGDTALDLLVTRHVLDGKVHYRLTPAGRAAAEKLLHDDE